MSSSQLLIMAEFKPITVDKPIPLAFDLGNLATFDTNPVDDITEEGLRSVSRDNVQCLINQLLSLPVKTSGDLTLINLPVPSSKLPREKSIPKAAPLTKWQQFAQRKNIMPKEKTGNLVFDEQSQSWKKKWGFNGVNKALDSQWLVEVDDKTKNTPDELIDPRTLKRAERKKLVKKNELQQKRNLKNAS